MQKSHTWYQKRYFEKSYLSVCWIRLYDNFRFNAVHHSKGNLKTDADQEGQNPCKLAYYIRST